MRPKNFPERRRQRQLRALERLLARLRQIVSPTQKQQDEIETLEQRTAQSLRQVQTKKKRGG